MNLDKYCKLGENYNIYNIYYDTLNNDVIRHSISKPYYKEKLRLRSYNIPTSLNDKVFLELKKKINGIVNKRRVVMTLGDVYEFLENGKKPLFDDYENKQVIKEIEYYLNESPLVSECIVLGDKPKGDKETYVTAKIYPNKDYIKEILNKEDLSEDDIKKEIKTLVSDINKKLPNFKHIKNFKIVKEPLEKTTTQKIKRFGNNLSI